MPDQICELDEKGQKKNYCPYGCPTEDLDEYGYCVHLQGFTNDGKIVEPLNVLYRPDRDKVPFDTGFKQVSARMRRAIKDHEFIYNPEFLQKGNDGIQRLVKKWASARVYAPVKGTDVLRLPGAEAPASDPAISRDVAELKKGISDLKDMVLALAQGQRAQSERLTELEDKAPPQQVAEPLMPKTKTTKRSPKPPRPAKPVEDIPVPAAHPELAEV
jgi:hypothetical protein